MRPDRPDLRTPPAYVGEKRPDEAVTRPPILGQMSIVLAALSIGILLMGIQLWLLTVALELYLAGEGDHIWWLAIISGAIFIGGLLMLRLLGRRPHVHRPGTDDWGLPPR